MSEISSTEKCATDKVGSTGTEYAHLSGRTRRHSKRPARGERTALLRIVHDSDGELVFRGEGSQVPRTMCACCGCLYVVAGDQTEYRCNECNDVIQPEDVQRVIMEMPWVEEICPHCGGR
jgi:hypothetical protein